MAPAEAAQSTKNTSDLLRRWKEYATSFRVGPESQIAHPQQNPRTQHLVTCCIRQRFVHMRTTVPDNAGAGGAGDARTA